MKMQSSKRARRLSTVCLVLLLVVAACGDGADEAGVRAESGAPESTPGPGEGNVQGALPRVDWQSYASLETLAADTDGVVVIEPTGRSERVVVRREPTEPGESPVTLWLGRTFAVHSVLDGEAVGTGDKVTFVRLGYETTVRHTDEASGRTEQRRAAVVPNSVPPVGAGYVPPMESDYFLVGLTKGAGFTRDVWTSMGGPNGIVRLVSREDGDLVVAPPNELFNGTLQTVLEGRTLDSLREELASSGTE